MNNRLKPYEEYKETELFYLEQIPKHWQLLRNKYIFTERNIRSKDGEEELLSLSQYTGVSRRKDKNLAGKGLLTNAETLVGYKIVKSLDLVMNIMLAWNGSLGISRFDGIISPAYCIFKVNANYNPWYFHYLLKTGTMITAFKTLSTGVIESRLRLYPESFYQLYSVVPPKEEQDQMVRFLDSKVSKINKFIKAKKRQIELLKEQKQAIINQAVTKGIDPDAKMKPSGIDWLGDIPEGWEVRPLKHFVKSNIETLTESFDKNATINYIDISTVGFGELKLEPVQYVFKEAPSRARRVIHVGDTIISTVRTYLKSMCYIDEELEGYIASTGFAVLTPSKEVFSKFLNYILSADYFVNMVSQNSIGVSYPAITESKLVTIKIAISPDIEEQKEILEYIKPKTIAIDKAIVAIKKEIDLITEYRTTLISNVVTGKVDVRHIEVEDIIDSIEEDFEDLDEGELSEELEMEEE